MRGWVDGLPHNSRLFPCSARAFRAAFRDVQIRAGFERPLFVPHSLRHGGACFDFNSEGPASLTLKEVMVRGRWAGLACTLIYIRESQAFLRDLVFPLDESYGGLLSEDELEAVLMAEFSRFV